MLGDRRVCPSRNLLELPPGAGIAAGADIAARAHVAAGAGAAPVDERAAVQVEPKVMEVLVWLKASPERTVAASVSIIRI